MTNMENMDAQMAEKERQQAVYERAMAELNAAPRPRAIKTYVTSDVKTEEPLMFSEGMLGSMAHSAQLFCIAFAMITPIVFLWAIIF
ncbi:hypothetical protein [Nereida sp. MMG025]|uniref:hypothetical protein n=1 Tax=Nereida sp. MMG025 TaxID=2909981 RepID=UPI001F2E72DA|nr:hypothetical protein [Nereida sp. MMG025]MCF6445563.1 hypothetical protein [Nereida sp. MMG025]